MEKLNIKHVLILIIVVLAFQNYMQREIIEGYEELVDDWEEMYLKHCV